MIQFDRPHGRDHPPGARNLSHRVHRLNFSEDKVPGLASSNPGLYWEVLELFNDAVMLWTTSVGGQQASYDLEHAQEQVDEAVYAFHEVHPEYNLPDAVTARVMERWQERKDRDEEEHEEELARIAAGY